MYQDREKISAVDPHHYAERFIKFMEDNIE